jgi:hypothetical protein
LVENTKPVEFGQPLFRARPAWKDKPYWWNLFTPTESPCSKRSW